MNIVDKLWNVVLANKSKSNNLFIIASEGKWTDTSCDMCVDDMFTVIDWIENKYTNPAAARTKKKPLMASALNISILTLLRLSRY